MTTEYYGEAFPCAYCSVCELVWKLDEIPHPEFPEDETTYPEAVDVPCPVCAAREGKA